MSAKQAKARRRSAMRAVLHQVQGGHAQVAFQRAGTRPRGYYLQMRHDGTAIPIDRPLAERMLRRGWLQRDGAAMTGRGRAHLAYLQERT